jgi:hypothetical protein
MRSSPDQEQRPCDTAGGGRSPLSIESLDAGHHRMVVAHGFRLAVAAGARLAASRKVVASKGRGMAKQLLHLVFGGELEDPAGVKFADLAKLDIVGIYPDYRSAYAAWRGAAQRTVDDAQVRYFIVHLHRLLDPSTDTAGS